MLLKFVTQFPLTTKGIIEFSKYVLTECLTENTVEDKNLNRAQDFEKLQLLNKTINAG